MLLVITDTSTLGRRSTNVEVDRTEPPRLNVNLLTATLESLQLPFVDNSTPSAAVTTAFVEVLCHFSLFLMILVGGTNMRAWLQLILLPITVAVAI